MQSYRFIVVFALAACGRDLDPDARSCIVDLRDRADVIGVELTTYPVTCFDDETSWSTVRTARSCRELSGRWRRGTCAERGFRQECEFDRILLREGDECPEVRR